MKPESFETYKRLLAKGCYFPNIDIKEYVGIIESDVKIYAGLTRNKDLEKERFELSTLVRIKEKGKWYVRLHLSTILLDKERENIQRIDSILKFLQDIHMSTHLGKVDVNFDMLDTCQMSEEERLRNTVTNYKPMKLETKFNLGEEAYVIVYNKVHKVVIKAVEIIRSHSVSQEEYVIEYCDENKDVARFKHTQLFKTRQDLLDTL